MSPSGLHEHVHACVLSSPVTLNPLAAHLSCLTFNYSRNLSATFPDSSIFLFPLLLSAHRSLHKDPLSKGLSIFFSLTISKRHFSKPSCTLQIGYHHSSSLPLNSFMQLSHQVLSVPSAHFPYGLFCVRNLTMGLLLKTLLHGLENEF